METTQQNDDEGGYGEKLIPEWRLAADDQVLLAGLAVVVALALALAWNIWRGGDDGGVVASVAPVAEEVAEASGVDGAGGSGAGSADGDGAAGGDGSGSGDGGDDGAVAAPTTTEAATTTSESTTTTEPTTTTTAGPSAGDVQAAVDPFPGAIIGTLGDGADGSVAVLDGFVANTAERDEAEAAAAAVDGVTAVENNLVVLEPAVLAALADAGVTGAAASGVGTEITVSGTIDSEDDRQPALDAAAAVDGVTAVVDDRLDVSVTADLNALPQVQFAYNSATILEDSFADLDTAAELLAAAGDAQIEIQGYTDVQGSAASNLELSQNRAEAVRSYLVDAGVDAASLTATGFGETTQFGDDLASNRLVRFQQIDG